MNGPKQRRKFDWAGSLIYGLTLASFMYGFSKLPSYTGWIFLGCGFIFGILFLLFEKKISNPVFDIRLVLKTVSLHFRESLH